MISTGILAKYLKSFIKNHLNTTFFSFQVFLLNPLCMTRGNKTNMQTVFILRYLIWSSKTSLECSQNFPIFFLSFVWRQFNETKYKFYLLRRNFLSPNSRIITSVRCPMLTKVFQWENVFSKSAFFIGSCHLCLCYKTDSWNFEIECAYAAKIPLLNSDDRCNYLFAYRHTTSQDVFSFHMFSVLPNNEQCFLNRCDNVKKNNFAQKIDKDIFHINNEGFEY